MAMEGELANGLIVGHAYSVTDARTVRISYHWIVFENNDWRRCASFRNNMPLSWYAYFRALVYFHN